MPPQEGQFMTIQDCRDQQGGCSSNLHRRLDGIRDRTDSIVAEQAKISTKIAVMDERSKRTAEDIAVIKKHLGINGQYTVITNPPLPPRRREDPPGSHHSAERAEGEVIVAHRSDGVPMVTFPKPPRWMVVMFVVCFMLAGVGVVLLVQNELDHAVIEAVREAKGLADGGSN